MRAHKKRAVLIRAVAVCLAAIAVLAAILIIEDRYEKEKYKDADARESGTKEFMESDAVIWQGNKYRRIPAVTTMLVAGIDKDGAQEENADRYRSGGQADFLLLLALDHMNEKIHQLQIDRDTMTDITVLSVFGEETGTRVLQICLAHSYGANNEDNAKYTVRAVSHLLNDLEITGYYMVDYSAVPILNDTLGGVTVTVPDDMTSVNPEWKKGSVVTLHGKEAETFVRTRMTVGQGTNQERMGRQNVFMQNAIAQMKSALASDTDFATQVLASLRRIAVSNMTQQQLLEEISRAKDYEVQPVEYLEGKYVIGDGYMEFYPNENNAAAWVMEHLYTRE